MYVPDPEITKKLLYRITNSQLKAMVKSGILDRSKVLITFFKGEDIQRKRLRDALKLLPSEVGGGICTFHSRPIDPKCFRTKNRYSSFCIR